MILPLVHQGNGITVYVFDQKLFSSIVHFKERRFDLTDFLFFNYIFLIKENGSDFHLQRQCKICLELS